MRLLVILLLVPIVLLAQQPPRAVPVDPALERNAGQDWFQHGRNVYESAKRSSGPTQFDLYQRAVEIFTRYLNDFPTHPNAEPAWWYLGQSYYQTGRVEEAKRCFHRLLNRFGRGRYAAAAAYTLGADHFNNRQYALAAALFEKLAVTATKPSDRQRGLYYAGKSYEMIHRRPQAIAAYRRLLKDPDPANAYRAKGQVGLGRLYLESGKLQQALDLLEKVVVSPSLPEIRGEAALHAGTAAARLGDAALSDKYFGIILTSPGMEASRPDAQIAMMAARFDQKRYQEVIQIFTRSSEPSEGTREARRLMIAARAYMMLKRNADAMPLFREIERSQPPDSKFSFDAAYYRLLCFYRIEGRHVLDQVDAFVQLYRKSHPRDAKIHTALLMKAETLYAENKTADAADVYREIDSALLSPSNRGGLLYQRGRCLDEAGDPTGAIKSLIDFIKRYPEDERIPLALVIRGRAYAATDQVGLAQASFDQLIQSSKDPKLLTLAYLQSAAISKEQGELDTMVARYLAFLENVPSAPQDSIAKASYWAGWGMVKKSRGPAAIPYLEKARSIAPQHYEKHAGLLLNLIYLSQKNVEKLAVELELAIEKNYAHDLPDQLIRWAADQAFNGGDFLNAARFYGLITDDENPELSPKEVWRFLGKSRIESGDAAGALIAIDYALANEQEQRWQADGQHDRGRALYMESKYDDAMAAVEQGLALRPEGRIGANLHLLRGDIFLARGNTEEAVRAYILPVQLMDDGDRVVKPRALYKLSIALEKLGKTQDAQRYRQELESKYPGWKPEKKPQKALKPTSLPDSGGD